MKSLCIFLIFLAISFTLKAETGFKVNILPDKLILPNYCEAIAKLKRLKAEPKKFSVGFSCKSKIDGSYFMDFRLNDLDIVTDFKKNSAKVDVSKVQFNSYTLYEISATSKEGEEFNFVSYCTKDICLDLVGDYKQSVKNAITLQLKEQRCDHSSTKPEKRDELSFPISNSCQATL